MRLNQFIAGATGISRRAADRAISAGRVIVNGIPGALGQEVSLTDQIELDRLPLQQAAKQYLLLNKPIGYVCSRQGQGNQTVYDLLPGEYRHLKPVGRLDKDSCGLLLMTNDGILAQKLTHPSFQKTKTYRIKLDKPLTNPDLEQLNKGIQLTDGPSHLDVKADGPYYRVRMHQGRNRQIRRSFAKLGYEVIYLERIQFGPWTIEDLGEQPYRIIKPKPS